MKTSRRLALAGTPVVLAGLVLMGVGATASADEGTAGRPTDPPGVVTLSASGVAVQSVYQSLNVPFGLPFAVGSYGASARLDSTGSTADAGAPYSPLVASVPGAGNGVASTMGYQLPVVPTFPGYVAAQYPNKPSDTQSAGAYELTAVTEAALAEGKVSTGAQGTFSPRNNLFALARTASTEQGLRVDANAGAVALTLPGILELANTSSEIVAVQGPGDSHPSFTTRTALGTLSVAGTTSGVTGNSSSLAGANAVPIDLAALPEINRALAPMGVSLVYLPASFAYTDGTSSTGAEADPKKTVRSLVSGALQIVIAQDSPGQGPSTETITVGQVAASAESSADAGGYLGAAGQEGGVAAPGSTLPGTASGGLPTGVDAAGLLPATGALTPGVGMSSAPVAAGGVPGISGLSGENVDLLLAKFGRIDFGASNMFGLLLGVGALIVVGSFVTRKFAVGLASVRGR